MVFPSMNHPKNTGVYPPQEDTWFLADILEIKFQEELMVISHPLTVCEIGVGGGFISIALAKKFPQIHFIGTDISPQSALSCQMNMSNHLHRDQFDLVCMDSIHGFNPLKFHPDLVYFNPPYVRTGLDEMKKGFLERTWAGGPSGIVVIQKFLKELSRFSFRKAFFLSSNLNENELLETIFHRIFKFQVISDRKIGDERLLCFEVRPKGY